MIIHIDIDSFFASVEQSLRPELATREVIVAHPEGMVLAANYIAKSKGVCTTDLTSLSLKKLSKPVLFNVRYGAYQLASEFFFANLINMLTAYPGAHFNQISIDECFIHLPYNLSLKQLQELRDLIYQSTNLPSSIGAGSSKLIAKQASKRAKPFGVLLISSEDELPFLTSFSLPDLWGFGPKSVEKMSSVGIDTVVDLLNSKQGRALGLDIPSLRDHLFDSSIDEVSFGKSISVERSKRRGFTKLSDFTNSYNEVFNELAFRLKQSKLGFKNFEARLYFSDYTYILFKHKESQHTGNINLLAHLASQAKLDFENYDLTRVSKISFHLSNLNPSTNLELFTDYPIFEIEPPKYTLDDLLFYGLPVKHILFGVGRVVQILDDALLVNFSDRSRIIADKDSLLYSF